MMTASNNITLNNTIAFANVNIVLLPVIIFNLLLLNILLGKKTGSF